MQGRKCSFAGAEDPTAMARSGIAAMRVPPLVPLPSSSNSNGGGFSDSFTTSASRFSSNVKNRECCFVACTFVVPRSRGGISKFSGFGKYLRQQQQLSRATVSDESSSDSTSAVSVFFFSRFDFHDSSAKPTPWKKSSPSNLKRIEVEELVLAT